MRRVIAQTAGVLACGWVALARRRYAGGARTLNDGERGVMAAYFACDLLDDVRVAEVDRITLPGSRVSPGGIALGRLVVVTREIAMDDASRAEARRRSLLFHELVHVAQYRAYGMRGFLTRYIRGWLDGGREYFEIPMERQAYALQERFDRGEKMSVEALVRQEAGL